jgi:hypothetical protein
VENVNRYESVSFSVPESKVVPSSEVAVWGIAPVPEAVQQTVPPFGIVTELGVNE